MSKKHLLSRATHLFPFQLLDAQLQCLQGGFGFGGVHRHWPSLPGKFECLLAPCVLIVLGCLLIDVVAISLQLALQDLPVPFDLKRPLLLGPIHVSLGVGRNKGAIDGRVRAAAGVLILTHPATATSVAVDGAPGRVAAGYADAGRVRCIAGGGGGGWSLLLRVHTLLLSILAQRLHLLQPNLHLHILLAHHVQRRDVTPLGKATLCRGAEEAGELTLL